MYKNLKSILAQKGITNRTVASVLGIHDNTVKNKFDKGPFTVDEAFKIKTVFAPEYSLEWLFAVTEEETLEPAV